MMFIQDYIQHGYTALEQHSFLKAFEIGGTGSGDGWFKQLWRDKIKKADFFESDLETAQAFLLKRDATQAAKKKSYIHIIFNRELKNWISIYYYEIVTGYCALGRLVKADQLALAKKLAKCAGSVSLIEIEAATPFDH
jgi:hypothetical protein